MNSKQIRTNFLEFFKNKEHTIVKSDNLVPQKDPSLLFTTAGMVQFKPLWIGAPLPYSRAVSVQKSLRAGGKGSDLENVGKTLRHHTFFEMLGNFSFGDYFKKEAIEFAWEFINDVLKLDTDRLWVSIYKDDDEAFDLWTKNIGFSAKKIVRLGDKDNFWGPAGPAGACGPCSEIHIDLGEERGCGKPNCTVGCDCERYLEFWNLVFPQYDQKEDGTRNPLLRRGIDTGMGLERLSFIMQEANNNYETDLFKPIIQEIENFSGIKYDKDNCHAFHVAADHVRTLTFAFSENILPSNEGRGYVLRKILRRGYRFGAKLGMKDAFLYKLVPVVVKIMQETYPELKEQEQNVTKLVKVEEENFKDTLNFCSGVLEEILDKSKKEKIICGDDAFRLYDTFGLPLDMVEDIADENDFKVDVSRFSELMQVQKDKSKTRKINANAFSKYNKVLALHKETEVLNFDKETKEEDTYIYDGAKMKALFKEDIHGNIEPYFGEMKQGEEYQIILDKTICYAESGGQVGDKGKIYVKSFEAEILDTIKPIPGLIVHKVKVIKGEFDLPIHGMNNITIEIDKERRKKISANHTATHILHNVLRSVLGKSVKQAGSFVSDDRLRFDFTHFSAITKEELDKIERLVNEKIFNNDKVHICEKTMDEAKKDGVIALFGEKYGDVVRIVSIGDVDSPDKLENDNAYSKELCGGTHVKMTGDIGLFKIIDEGSVASGTRRIEAITGIKAYDILKQKENIVKELLNITKISEDKLVEKTENLIKDIKEKEKEIKNIKQKDVLADIDNILESAVTKGNIKIIAKKMDISDISILKSLIDNICKKQDNILVVFGADIGGKAVFVSGVSKNLVSLGVHAGNIVRETAKIAGGSGGGRPDFAQAGAKDISKIEDALSIVKDLV